MKSIGLTETMPKHIVYTDHIYYDVGRQLIDFELQQQKKDGFFSKRKKYRDVGFTKSRWLLYANARTILSNEIVLDFDIEKKESIDNFEKRILQTINVVKKYHRDVRPFYSGSKGVHVHIFDQELLKMNTYDREEHRESMLKMFGADTQKKSERTTIALEYAPHWKTGKPKVPLKDKHFEDMKEVIEDGRKNNSRLARD
jgi:hypothetical protein